jgi:hypothetical protein
VTKSHPGLVSRAHPIREKVLAYLRHDPRCATVLTGDREAAVMELHRGYTQRLLLSADLTAATDRIPFELALGLWEGIRRNGLVDEVDWEVI